MLTCLLLALSLDSGVNEIFVRFNQCGVYAKRV